MLMIERTESKKKGSSDTFPDAEIFPAKDRGHGGERIGLKSSGLGEGGRHARKQKQGRHVLAGGKVRETIQQSG